MARFETEARERTRRKSVRGFIIALVVGAAMILAVLDGARADSGSSGGSSGGNGGGNGAGGAPGADAAGTFATGTIAAPPPAPPVAVPPVLVLVPPPTEAEGKSDDPCASGIRACGTVQFVIRELLGSSYSLTHVAEAPSPLAAKLDTVLVMKLVSLSR